MPAKFSISILVLLLMSGCAIYKTPEITKIALLAPFEGQYREIGYDALYAARLAIADSDVSNIDLLPIHDGGRVELATQRIQAMNQDPSIAAVIVLGQFSASAEAQMALKNIPMLIVGHWNARPRNASTYMLSNPQIDAMLNFQGDIHAISTLSGAIQGSEILALEQVPRLLDDLSLVSIYSSGSLPDDNFRERYLDSAEFAPEPGLLASLTYDATQIVLQSIQNDTPISDIDYEGINGHIRFDNGYWLDAPLNRYGYEDSRLVKVD